MGARLWSDFAACPQTQMRLMLGGDWLEPARPPESEAEAFREQCAQARWMLDKASKNCLLMCWKLRQALVGKMSVCNGRLDTEKSDAQAARVLLARQAMRKLAGAAAVGCRQFCMQWATDAREADSASPGRRKRRAAFYVVFAGREPGICSSWFQCRKNVANYAGARFRGYASLEAAETAWRRTPGDPPPSGVTLWDTGRPSGLDHP